MEWICLLFFIVFQEFSYTVSDTSCFPSSYDAVQIVSCSSAYKWISNRFLILFSPPTVKSILLKWSNQLWDTRVTSVLVVLTHVQLFECIPRNYKHTTAHFDVHILHLSKWTRPREFFWFGVFRLTIPKWFGLIFAAFFKKVEPVSNKCEKFRRGDTSRCNQTTFCLSCVYSHVLQTQDTVGRICV